MGQYGLDGDSTELMRVDRLGGVDGLGGCSMDLMGDFTRFYFPCVFFRISIRIFIYDVILIMRHLLTL